MAGVKEIDESLKACETCGFCGWRIREKKKRLIYPMLCFRRNIKAGNDRRSEKGGTRVRFGKRCDDWKPTGNGS